MNSNSRWRRRGFVLATASAVVLMGCSNPDDSIDPDEQSTSEVPSTPQVDTSLAPGGGAIIPTAPSGPIVLPTVSSPSNDSLILPTTIPTTPPTTVVPTQVLQSDVLFAPASALLSDSARGKLADLARKITDEYSEATLTILGHTDSRGTDAANLRLSADRARAVLEVFVQAGIPRESMRSEGRGETQLLAVDTDANGRFDEAIGERNRRVEIIIVPA
jgi:OOP family OmpA-OmpF porin